MDYISMIRYNFPSNLDLDILLHTEYRFISLHKDYNMVCANFFIKLELGISLNKSFWIRGAWRLICPFRIVPVGNTGCGGIL